ncbi:MAG: methyltransferase domain-containing protein [Betaproteobacteria bacterium]|nr:MAG: methyltransferase domain-containing protein [Betaproteobacteria bacterium]
MIRHDNSVFDADKYVSVVREAQGQAWSRFLPSPSVNLAETRVLGRMRSSLDQRQFSSILVVGAGRQRDWLDALLKGGIKRKIIYSDIDVAADVDLFCDGHELPFVDASFDAVVTTAVLEHVLYPEQVASEINRVLKVGGLLYSEMPFMQQVHEGAYDFTRYTLSGHRRLFNGFEEIEAGMVAGPGTALVWSIEGFVQAFFSGRRLTRIAKASSRLCFFWLKYFDYLLAKRAAAMDGASCTYFFGKKIEGHVPDEKIISRYTGAKHLRHL